MSNNHSMTTDEQNKLLSKILDLEAKIDKISDQLKSESSEASRLKAELSRYSRIIDVKEQWALSLDNRLREAEEKLRSQLDSQVPRKAFKCHACDNTTGFDEHGTCPVCHEEVLKGMIAFVNDMGKEKLPDSKPSHSRFILYENEHGAFVLGKEVRMKFQVGQEKDGFTIFPSKNCKIVVDNRDKLGTIIVYNEYSDPEKRTSLVKMKSGTVTPCYDRGCRCWVEKDPDSIYCKAIKYAALNADKGVSFHCVLHELESDPGLEAWLKEQST